MTLEMGSVDEEMSVGNEGTSGIDFLLLTLVDVSIDCTGMVLLIMVGGLLIVLRNLLRVV